MKKYLLSAIAIMALGSNLYAKCNAKTCYDKVERLFITANGNIYVATAGDERKLGCKLSYGKYMKLPANSPATKSIYSALLTSQTTGNKAMIRIKDGSNDCQILYVTIDKK